ncbi:hypothetical protein ACJIZ3_004682 [Penstemon smallii]|uniref:Uncharacterized protein n=1 Tax=Penstemon smallii TaxID=265156 RepID=A0ABD3S2V7_9LAMI
MGESAVIRLGGKVGVMDGPTTTGGIMLMNSMSLQLVSSYSGFWCSSTFKVPADVVKINFFTVFALTHDLMMLNMPSIVGLITSFYRYFVNFVKFINLFTYNMYLWIEGVEFHRCGQVKNPFTSLDCFIKAPVYEITYMKRRKGKSSSYTRITNCCTDNIATFKKPHDEP